MKNTKKAKLLSSLYLEDFGDPHAECYLLEEKPYTGFAYEANSNGGLQSLMEIQEGLVSGWLEQWDSDGCLIYESRIELFCPGGYFREWFPSGILRKLSYLDFGVTLRYWTWNEDGTLNENYDIKTRGYESPLLETCWLRFRTQRDQPSQKSLTIECDNSTETEVKIRSRILVLQSGQSLNSDFLGKEIFLTIPPIESNAGTINDTLPNIVRNHLGVKEIELCGWFVLWNADELMVQEHYHCPNEPGNFARTWHPNGQLATEQHSDFDIVVWENHWDELGHLTLQIEHLPGSPEWQLLEKRWAAYRKERD